MTTTSNLKEIAAIFESLIKCLGIIVGAIWVYIKFIKTREGSSKAQFFVDLRIIGRQDDKIIIEVIGNLENKSLIRRYIKNFTCDILILKASDPILNGGIKTNYQLLFMKHNPVNEDAESEKQKRIEWIPETWQGGTFIDPGLIQRYTYLSAVPGDTTFISIFSKFSYLDKKKGEIVDFQTSQKTFSVSKLELRE